MQNDVRLTDAYALREMFVKKCYQECLVCPERDQESGECWLILSPPIIDAEPVVHARWEWREDWGSGAFQDPPEIYDSSWACSACGVDLLRYLQSHFPDIPSYTECASEDIPTLDRCPCCGAKMDGGAENANSR